MRGGRWRIVAMGAAGALAVASGCSGDQHGSAATSTSTTTSIAPSTTSAAAPTTTATSSALVLTPLPGSWFGHGRGLVIRMDGTFDLSFRTYQTCGEAPAPCDPYDAQTSEIGSGGHVTGHIVAGSRPSWEATVDTSNDPDVVAKGPATITYDEVHHAVVISQGPQHEDSYCSETSPPGYCGA